MEKKYRYNVGLSAEEDFTGTIDLTKSEAAIVAYATDTNNWQNTEGSGWCGTFWIDINNPMEIEEISPNKDTTRLNGSKNPAAYTWEKEEAAEETSETTKYPTYKELAKAIMAGYNELKNDRYYKLYHVVWNNRLQTSEITIENDEGFTGIRIGDCESVRQRGFMFLFCTDNNMQFPTIQEIERRLKQVANQEVLTDEDVAYFDWEEYGSLAKQREYFAEVIKNAINHTEH